MLILSVLDRGPGIAPQDAGPASRGLGLIGLTDRIEALGGKLELLDRADGIAGAELRMTIEIGG